MANTTHAHKEHVLPLRLYFSVFAGLLVLTALTVYIAGFQFGAFNLVVAMAVAVVKASLVALFFMHLKYDNKVFMLIFVTSIAFLGIFVTFTMADTMTRGSIDSATRNPLIPEATIYRGEGLDRTNPHTPEVQTMAPGGLDSAQADTGGLDTVIIPGTGGADTLATDSATADTIRSTDTLAEPAPQGNTGGY